MNAFKAYDIRGVYGRDFNGDDAYRIGFFLPALLSADTVLVGRDARKTSDEIYARLVAGITDSGADVCTMGLATTPMVYFGTAHNGFDASVQITASHNPPEYNGFKISRTDAIPVGYETGLADLEKKIRAEHPVPVPPDKKGKVREISVEGQYLEFMSRYVPDISGLEIGVDCSNGMAGLAIKQIMGTSPKYIYDEIDGSFPNHQPNPLVEENVEDLKRLVVDNTLDIGIIFDGDGDRVMFVDELGRFVRPDLVVGIMALYFLKGASEPVLYDVRTSRSVTEYIESMGGVPHMWKVGHAYAKVRMREISAVYGGELAGHYYFRDFFNCDSGILAALIVLDIVAQLKQEGQSLATLVDSIDVYANTGELNFKIDDKTAAVETLKDSLTRQEQPVVVHDFDGYRVEYVDWWFNVRPSNTEPYLRLIIEARDEELLLKKRRDIESILKQFTNN